MPRKAAIVIGVDKTGGLKPLKSAASCAHEVGGWLEGEGYDVECLTDRTQSVTTDRLRAAIDRFVTSPPRYHQLLLYFSGHGYWHARTDIWLFSEAPVRTEEGINLDGAIDLARYSGIPNVVFVSDACRSIPDARTGALMKGIDAFPNLADVVDPSKVDVFKATSDAQQAYEAVVDGEPKSMLTHALLSAYVEPTAGMVREIQENGTTVFIVPNRRLEDFLQEKVDATLADIDINLIQKIEVNVPSSDDVYIARVKDPGRGVPPTDSGEAPLPPPPAPSIERDAASGIGRLLSKRRMAHGGDPAMLDFEAADTSRQVASRLPVAEVDHFESQCGFSVRGAQVEDALSTRGRNGAHVEILSHGSGSDEPGVLRVWDAEPGVSVLIRFADGRAAVVAALSGYIGHVVCGPDGAKNVSYVPSSNHWRWHGYERRRERVDRLRALVALAADHNVFRLRSDREATSLGDAIRVAKAMDPTLGLYAVHAFSQAGEIKRIRSVAKYMRRDLNADLFDVRTLASRQIDDESGADPDEDPAPQVLPFCPLLTQTWNLLRPRGIELPPVLTKASAYLCNSLWTTFEPEGASMLQLAMEQEELT
jgi:hypothetical protein